MEPNKLGAKSDNAQENGQFDKPDAAKVIADIKRQCDQIAASVEDGGWEAVIITRTEALALLASVPSAVRDSEGAALDCLRELVTLKDMHDRVETRGNGISGDEARELNREYRRRRPVAWEQARAILKNAAPQVAHEAGIIGGSSGHLPAEPAVAAAPSHVEPSEQADLLEKTLEVYSGQRFISMGRGRLEEILAALRAPRSASGERK